MTILQYMLVTSYFDRERKTYAPVALLTYIKIMIPAYAKMQVGWFLVIAGRTWFHFYLVLSVLDFLTFSVTQPTVWRRMKALIAVHHDVMLELSGCDVTPTLTFPVVQSITATFL